MPGIGITVLKRNAPWGPFTREQIEEGLKRGDFTVNYLAHAPGLKEWLPLGEVLDYAQRHPGLPGVTLPPVPTPVDLPPLPQSAGLPEAPAPSPLPDPRAQMSTRPTGPPPEIRPPILPPPRRPLPQALEQVASAPSPHVPAPETKTGPKPIPDTEPEPVDNLETAPFLTRAIAFFLDGAIVFLPVLVLTIVGALCIEVPAFIRHITHEARMEEWELLALNDHRLSWFIISIGWLYGAAFEASPSGATLGKRWMGLRVVDGGGEPISFFRAVGRNVGKYFSGGIFFLGFLMALFGVRHRTLHDMMSDTRVVRD